MKSYTKALFLCTLLLIGSLAAAETEEEKCKRKLRERGLDCEDTWLRERECDTEYKGLTGVEYTCTNGGLALGGWILVGLSILLCLIGCACANEHREVLIVRFYGSDNSGKKQQQQGELRQVTTQ
eukprot:TRINITY_DN48425_c0_g1_i1.p2 TRINITY_DN48425_c0_g1~~TRINITY_DN48425_c0_g1_i1.p2  ORF type:complete len:125 (-),score=63.47 TRINITY_DN48425_c0_g1_i1:105-479(-)